MTHDHAAKTLWSSYYAPTEDPGDATERRHAEAEERAARIRHHASTARCTCLDGGEPVDHTQPADGRCARCWGLRAPPPG